MAAAVVIAAPPGGHRRQQQLLAEEVLGQPGQVRQEAGVLEHPAAEGVDDGDATEAGRFDEAGHAEPRVGAQLERIAEPRVGAAQDDVDAFEPAERAQPHAPVAHREVGGFDQRVAEIRGEVRVLEGGLAPRTGAEQHDPGIIGARRRQFLQRRPQHAEERGQPVDLRVAVQAREHPRDDDAVLERVARARRCLGVVGEHGAATGAVAGEVDRGGEQLLAAGQADLVALTEEAGVPEHQLGGAATRGAAAGGARRGR